MTRAIRRRARHRVGAFPTLYGLAAVLVLAALPAACGGDEGPNTPEPPDEPDYEATLNAASFVGGDIQSAATASAEFDLVSGVLEYEITASNLEAAIAAHIHGPAATDQNADIILDLFTPDAPTGTVNGRLVRGTVAEGSGQLRPGWTLTQVLELMNAGTAYVLIHTSQYPDGEIRGQVVAN